MEFVVTRRFNNEKNEFCIDVTVPLDNEYKLTLLKMYLAWWFMDYPQEAMNLNRELEVDRKR